MDWLLILGLMLFGTFLIVAEIIFVPGTTIIGILGAIFSVYCIYLGYDYYGPATGTLVLIGSVMLNILALVIAFKNKSWERFSLKNTMKGKFNEDSGFNIKKGDKGMTISSLKPIGKAIFGSNEVEVRSEGGFVTENIEIEVKRIDSSKIIVQPINN
ncbi:MAG: nodulation protein NfeD [Ekhidna sp.]|nr:nodulation protein NfeD [Ekhidna sp.]MBC6409346.1 nodulation protein NfeD [Ekhidna sp.]MBC6425561.1 nodulation protein NfeD [Ekhidna sp.]